MFCCMMVSVLVERLSGVGVIIIWFGLVSGCISWGSMVVFDVSCVVMVVSWIGEVSVKFWLIEVLMVLLIS